MTALFARSSGEVERYRNTPVELRLTLSQVMLLGGMIGMVASAADAPPDMVARGIELAEGIARELAALECHGVAGMILASLPGEREVVLD